VQLTASGALDLDVPAVRVTGQVTLNGAPMPSGVQSRGALTFQLGEGGTASADLVDVGPASYDVVLLPGSYTIGYSPNGSCSAGALTPCNGGPLKTAVWLLQPGALDVDVPTVQVSGRVTLNGAVMPSTIGERGALNFTRVTGGGTTTPSFGSTGPVTYGLVLMPGNYVIQYSPTGGSCGDLQAVTPCNSEVLAGCPQN
jgi:hypothetical protein